MLLKLSKIQCHSNLINLPLLLGAQAESLNFGWATSVTEVWQLSATWEEKIKATNKATLKQQYHSLPWVCFTRRSAWLSLWAHRGSYHTKLKLCCRSIRYTPTTAVLRRQATTNSLPLNQHLSWDQRLCTPTPMHMWKAFLFESSAGSTPEGSDPGEQAGFRAEQPEMLQGCAAVPPALSLQGTALPAGSATLPRHALLR